MKRTVIWCPQNIIQIIFWSYRRTQLFTGKICHPPNQQRIPASPGLGQLNSLTSNVMEHENSPPMIYSNQNNLYWTHQAFTCNFQLIKTQEIERKARLQHKAAARELQKLGHSVEQRSWFLQHKKRMLYLISPFAPAAESSPLLRAHMIRSGPPGSLPTLRLMMPFNTT